MPDVQGQVLVKGTGGAGLGDLIRALLAGLHYATLSGRGLVPCWDDGLYATAGTNVFPRLFGLTGIASPPLAGLDANDVAPPAWRGRLHLPLGRVYAQERADDWNRAWALAHLSFEQKRLDHPESTLVMWDFDGFPASWAAVPALQRIGGTADEALRLLARRHLRPAPAVLEGVRTVVERFAARMIGVHVRKTHEKGGATRHLDLEGVFLLLDGILTRVPAGDSGVFLATDNREVETAFRERYPRVLCTSKWFGTPGVALHFNDDAPDKTQVAVEALVDLYLLAACDWLLHPAESSFSRVAAVLGDIPQSRVFAIPPGAVRMRRRWHIWRWTRAALAGVREMGRDRPYFL